MTSLTPPVTVEILLYEGFDELDGVGPDEVFETAAAFGGGFSARMVTLESSGGDASADATRDWVPASHGLRVGVDGVLGHPDVLVVPGGGWNAGADNPGARREATRGDVPAAIRERHENGTVVASVCTGGMLLSAAGLLDGRPAVTHGSAMRELRETRANVVDARVVDDGDVLTAGGVTSGIDLALHLVARVAGTDHRDRVATELEYDYSDVFVAGESNE